MQGNEVVDGMVNWEASTTSDADRFSQSSDQNLQSKSTKLFDEYLKKKAIRAKLKIEKKKNKAVLHSSNAHH